MMWICIGLIIVALPLLASYLKEKIKGYTVKSVLIKTLVSALFIAVAVLATYEKQGHIISPFIILGLLFGLSGDIWLDLKYVYPKDDKIYTYAGFIVFGAGHILFITGMYLEFFDNANALYIVLPLLGALVVAVVNQILAKPLKLEFGHLKRVVFLYAFTLFSLPLCTLSLLILHHWDKGMLIMLFIGGLLFAASDLVLSNTYFGKGHEKPIDFIFNYLLYYGAQFVIASSILLL